MKNFKRILFASTIALTAGTANAALIDDFDGGSLSVSAPGSQTISYGNAIGGFRTVEITKSGPLGATAAVLTPPGIYSHSADALTSATSTITWDANGAGLGGVNLIDPGTTNNVFTFDILTIDQGNIDLVLSVADILGNSASSTLSGAGTGLQSYAFNNFTGIDFTQVNSIALQVVGGNASDLTLDSLGTSGDPVQNNVPEPASLALLGLGLAAFSFGRKRQA